MKFFKTKKYSILSGILKYSFVIVFAFAICAPMVWGAEDLSITSKINNPLGDKITDLPSFIKIVVEIVLTVGIPILALAIIYTGYLFVAAQGNSNKLKEAKDALLAVLIGGALLLGAFVIAEAIGGTVDDIKKNIK